MYHRCKTVSKEIGDDDVIDDIIKSKSRSIFSTAVTLLIFKLERRTNAQISGIGLAIWRLYWFQNHLNHYSCRHYFTSDHNFGNFGKYGISDCSFITYNFGKYIRLSVCYLPKFDFDKYVRWSCLSACLKLAKILFWQVCSLVLFVCLLLAKIWFWQVCWLVLFVCYLLKFDFGKYVRWSCLLLAKIWFWQVYWLVMFVTCQNLHFGKYVPWSCLSVCLSVCLFVCTEISQNLKNDSVNHHQTWSQASTCPWFLQVRWTRM